MRRVLQTLNRLRDDELGGLIAAEYLLMGTLLTIGLIVGVASIQDAILDQLYALAALISP